MAGLFIAKRGNFLLRSQVQKPPTMAVSTKPPTRDPIGSFSIEAIFHNLNQSSIGYCQFKSTANLTKSFEGRTDFDLLVRKSDYEKLKTFLLSHGFKQRITSIAKRWVSMEDYLYFESKTGLLHHVHIHYDIIFGTQRSKNYCLPYSDQWIAESVMHSEFPIRITAPENEVILLVLRIFIKQTTLSLLKDHLDLYVRSKPLCFGRMLSELKLLLQSVDRKKLDFAIDRTHPLLSPVIRHSLELVESKRHSFISYVRAKRASEKALAPLGIYKPKAAKIGARLRSDLKPYSPSYVGSGGRLIALIGCDGAGKTSLAGDLRAWLGRKVAVEAVYLGQAKNLRARVAMLALSKLANRLHCKKVSMYCDSVVCILDARVRATRCNESFRRTRQGITVLADRYPLKEFWNMRKPMDGPRLDKSAALYDQEQIIYKTINDYPDLTLILNVSYETCVKRKPPKRGHESQLQDKIFAIKALNNIPNSKVLDAEQSYHTVLTSAKQFIWDNL
jgi:thymidylate kinase